MTEGEPEMSRFFRGTGSARMRRRMWFTAASAVVSIAAVIIATQPAYATHSAETVFIRKANTNLFLDIPYGYPYNHQKVQQWGGNWSNAQKFRYVYRGTTGDGTRFYTWHPYSDLSYCFDVTGWDKENHAKIQLYKCHYGKNQQFKFKAAGGGSSLIVSMFSGKCLDVPGNTSAWGVQIQQYSCNYSGAQRFETLGT